tara:strand:- start:7760 stop:8137 length:378 start_codon:yes stop_codon:yes gene_type:complete
MENLHIKVLKKTSTKYLLQALTKYKEEKKYLYIYKPYSSVNYVINWDEMMGIFIKRTNVFQKINKNNWNGVDFIIENNQNTKFHITEILKERLVKESSMFYGKQIERANELIRIFNRQDNVQRRI